jgi:hypothetical protein
MNSEQVRANVARYDQRHHEAVRDPTRDERAILDLVDASAVSCLYAPRRRRVLESVKTALPYWIERGDSCYVCQDIVSLMLDALAEAHRIAEPTLLRDHHEVTSRALFVAANMALDLDLGRLDGRSLSKRLNNAAEVAGIDAN